MVKRKITLKMNRGDVCQNLTHIDENPKIPTLQRRIKCGRLSALCETRHKFSMNVKI